MQIQKLAEIMITEIQTRKTMHPDTDEETACWILDEYNTMFGTNLNPEDIEDFPG